MLIKAIRIIFFIAWFAVNVYLGSISGEVKEATTNDRNFYKERMSKFAIFTCIAYWILGGMLICSTL